MANLDDASTIGSTRRLATIECETSYEIPSTHLGGGRLDT
jgi:hypothetical protein